MRRNTVLALSLAAGLALPLGLPTAALAITPDQKKILSDANANVDLDMQAAISMVLNQELAAQERPLREVLDDLAEALLELGVTDELKAEYAVALVAAAGEWSDEAGKDAAEAVLVRAQSSPTLVSAILAKAGDMASTGVPGGQGTGVLGAFQAAALTSISIDLATADAVFSKSAELGQQASGSDLAGTDGGTGAGTQVTSLGTGAGPLGGAPLGGGANPGRGGGGQQTGAGQSASPN